MTGSAPRQPVGAENELSQLRMSILPYLLVALFSSWSAGAPSGHPGRSHLSHRASSVQARPGWPDAGTRRIARQPKKVEGPVQWRVLAPPSGKRVEIGKFVAWCAGIGRPKPRISRVLESDQGDRILLTAYLAHRAHGQCGRVGVLVSRTVILRRPLGQRKLYDGSVHPAAKRWPRPAQ